MARRGGGYGDGIPAQFAWGAGGPPAQYGGGGGGTHGYHYKEPRPLTNRERARIQTFPDEFIFEGKYGSVRKQIGMAVPPLLSKIIFNELLKQLN